MKQLHFDNLGKNRIWIMVILISLIFIFIEELPLTFEFENVKAYKILIKNTITNNGSYAIGQQSGT